MTPHQAASLPFDPQFLPFIPFCVASSDVLTTYIDVTQIAAIEEAIFQVGEARHTALTLHMKGGGTISVWDTQRKFMGLILGAMKLHEQLKRAQDEARESHNAPSMERTR